MEKLYGPPGTGKTHTLLTVVEESLEAGVKPARIGYLAFTKKAASEAATRACERFGFSTRQLPYFRTIHSLAFTQLGLNKAQVMGKKEYQELGDKLGLELTGSVSVGEGTVSVRRRGDLLLFIENLARIRGVDLLEQWRSDPLGVGWHELERFQRSLDEYKRVREVYDFTDMLSRYIHSGAAPELDLLVIDEAQDLSRLQWLVVHKLAENSSRTIVAGDDDQAIFRWAGADVDYFLNLEGTERVLDRSYRVPCAVQSVSDQIIKRVAVRKEKTWEAREEEGSVSFHSALKHVDFTEGRWLVLARSSYQLEEAEEWLQRLGLLYVKNGRISIGEATLNAVIYWERLRKGKAVPGDLVRVVYKATKQVEEPYRSGQSLNPEDEYTLADLRKHHGLKTEEIWHKALDRIPSWNLNYLEAALRRGEKPTKDPRIVLSTIHGAKGGEADNVVVFTDISPKSFYAMQERPEDEIRTFFVAVTRTRENLHIILPRTRFSFPLASEVV